MGQLKIEERNGALMTVEERPGQVSSDKAALKAALEAARKGIEVLVQPCRGLDSFYAERSGLIIGY